MGNPPAEPMAAPSAARRRAAPRWPPPTRPRSPPAARTRARWARAGSGPTPMPAIAATSTATSSPPTAASRSSSPLGLSLYRAGGQAGDVVLDKEGIDQRHRDRAQQRPGHQLAPVEHVASDQFGDDADRHGAYRALGQEDQGVQKLVLRQREGEDARRDEPGRTERQEDLPHRL